MKSQFSKILIVLILIISFTSVNPSKGHVNEPFQKVAVIIDSNEFYDSFYVEEVINGFNSVNNTFGINYEVFLLANFSNPDVSQYQPTYYYNNTATNHTELTLSLIASGEYDLITLVGYELRRGFDISEHPNQDFLFYDLAGLTPYYSAKELPENLMVVSFNENEVGYIAGALTTAIFSPLPDKIGIIGTYRGDHRSKRLIAGFQSAIFRNTSDASILISYIEDWVDKDKAESIASSMKDEGYGLIFSALQNENNLGVLKGFPNKPVIQVDTNRSYSVLKNHTKTLMYLFNEFNKTGFKKGILSFSIRDNSFYASDWGSQSEDIINKTLVQVHEDVVENSLVIPNDFIYAENTSGFELIILISSFVFIPLVRIKKRER